MNPSQLPWLAEISAAELKRLFESTRAREQRVTRSGAPMAQAPRPNGTVLASSRMGGGSVMSVPGHAPSRR